MGLTEKSILMEETEKREISHLKILILKDGTMNKQSLNKK